MAFTAPRTDEQGYTYPQIRSAVADKIAMADVLGLIALITPGNLVVIDRCDSRLTRTETQANTTSVEQLYDDYEQLKTDLAAVGTVDDALEYFTSTNANLANMSSDFEDIILSYDSYSVADISSYVADVDTVRQLKEDVSCL